MRIHPFHSTLVLFLGCALAIVLFSLGIAEAALHFWGRYLLPIVLVYLWGRRRDIYVVTALVSALVAAEYWRQAADGAGDFLVNGLGPMLALWAAAWLLAQRRQLLEQMTSREQELDAQVKLRMAELQARESARQQLEAALHASEENYRALFNQAGDGIFCVDPHGIYLDVNDSYCRLLGRPRAEIVGAHLNDMTVGITPEFFAAIGEQIARNGSATFERRLRHKDGTFRDVEVAVSPLSGSRRMAIVRDIGQRKRVEDALRQSEQKWRRVFEFLPVGLSVVDNRNQVTESNPALAQILAMTPEGIQQGRYEQRRYFRPDLSPMPPEEFPSLRALRAGQIVRDVEIGVEKEDGELTWVSVSATPESFDGLALTVTVDITAQKRAEQALRESEQKFRMLFEQAGDGIFYCDAAGVCLDANIRSCQMLGRTLAEVVGAHMSDMTVGATPEFIASVGRELAARGVAKFERQLRHMNGSLLEVEVKVAPLLGDRRISIVRDITERKRLEAALRASEARYRLLVDSAEDVIWTVDLEGRFTFVNPAVEHQLGYRPEEVIGQRFDRWLTPASTAAAMEMFAAAAVQVRAGQRPEIPQFEGEQIRNDGTQIFTQTVGVPLLDESARPIGFLGITRDVTERKRAEVERLAMVERWDMAAQMASIGVWDWHAGSDAVIWDERMCLLHGLAPGAAMTFAVWRSLIHPDDRAAVAENSRRSGLERTRMPVEYRVALPDGSLRHLLSFGGGLYDEAGTPVRQLGISMDITERKRAEEALRDSQARYQMLADHATDVIWSMDPACKVTYVSPSVLRQRGFTPEEAMGHTLEETFAPDSRAAVRATVGEIYRLIQAGEPVPATPNVFEMLRKDGTSLWGENSYSAVYNEQGEFQQLVGATREVTRRVHAQAELREAYQRLRLAADAAGIGIWNWNFVDNSLEWDDRMCELYAVTADERAAGFSYALWHSRIHPDDLALAEPAEGDLSYRGGQRSNTFRIVLPGGAVRYIQSSSTREYDREGKPRRTIGVNRDVTDQMLYEQLMEDTNAVLEDRVAVRTADLRSALAELQRASRLKDEFLAMISHELRTPLTGVLSMSEMLEDQIAGSLNARQATYVKGIRASGERLLAVINGILTYTHLLSGKVEVHAERCNLAYLLAICAASQQQNAAEKRQAIAVHVEPPDLAITIDGTALAEVLKRLLDNAVKFTPEGGHIGLAARRGIAPGTVDLIVRDTGAGIAPEQIDHIFHAFVQGDGSLARSHEGLGLGLAYVDQMVRLLGGTVVVDSEPGAGARFIITLPARLAL